MAWALERRHTWPIEPYGQLVTQIREATSPETAAWLDQWRARLAAWYGRLDAPSEWVNAQVTTRVAGYETGTAAAAFAITEGDEFAGITAVSVAQPDAMIHDIWIDPEHRRRGHGAGALRLVQGWAREQGAAALWVLTDPAEPAHAALFARYPIRAHQMIKRITGPGELPDGLYGRPMTQDEFTDWRARAVEGYAAQRADSGAQSAAEAAAHSAAEFDMLLPDGLATADQTFVCLCKGDEVVATNWICHRRAPGTSWVYDVEVSEQHRGKGYGRAAMIIGERATLDAADTHLALNVFGQNTVAIGLYYSMGYQAYDRARSVDLEQIQP
jgi:GNAT superfamily N-acetyltransferase